MPILDMTLARPSSRARSRFSSPLLGLQVARGFESQPGADGAGAHAEQHRDVMNFAAVAGLDGEANFGAHAGLGERVVHRAGGHGHGHGKRVGRGAAIGEQQQRCAVGDQFDGARREDVDGNFEGGVGGIDAVQNRVRHVGRLRVFAVLEGMHLRRA